MRKIFRKLLEENNWVKEVPNALTVCNSLCGFAAILNTLQIYRVEESERGSVLAVSACMILGAMFFDALDGFTARILNAASLRGLQMDSLADMVTFGVAPAVLVAAMAHLHAATKLGLYMAWGLCGIYLACAAFRLARYNIHAMVEKKSGEKFLGLPSPGAAAAVCAMVIFFFKYDNNTENLIRLLPIYAGLLGLLMASDIQYQHMGKWIESVRRNKTRLLTLIAFLLCLVKWPEASLAAVINSYVIFGLAKDFFVRYKEWKCARINLTSMRV